MALRVLFLDMNSFFASVEQQLDPRLRDRPMAVAPMRTEHTCCIAASYEAKARGVKTGTAVWEARRLCPGIRIVEAKVQQYVKAHHAIVDAVESCAHVSAVQSIDEMRCRLIGAEGEPENAKAIALRIKASIRERVGVCLRCSIGIAPNRLLAKVAADMMKPDGLTVINDADLPHVLHPLPLQDIPGISSAMERRLHRTGIKTMAQLCAATSDQLYSAWHSVMGRYMWHGLRGDDLPEILTSRRTVGHSHVLPPDLRTDDGSRAVMTKLIAKAAERLRRLGYWADRMVMGIEHSDGEPWEEVAPLGRCQDTLTMIEALAEHWPRRPKLRPFRASVTLLRLSSDQSVGAPLFAEQVHRTKLAHAVDRINEKMGRDAVWYGSMHDGINDARLSAPTRISYTQIPDLVRDF